jgi:hypothetical protein
VKVPRPYRQHYRSVTVFSEQRRANMSSCRLRGVLGVRSEMIVPVADAKSCRYIQIPPTVVGIISHNFSSSKI